MSDYTANEVEAAIEALIDGGDKENEDGEEYSWSELAYGDVPETLSLRGEDVPVTHVIQVGGEGQGDEIWFVIQVGDQLFRKDGYYASHYGSDWDGDFSEVRATQKTITVYE